MSCGRHPQWVHAGADCPLCLELAERRAGLEAKVEAQADLLAALQQELDAWKNAIIDASIVNWTYTKAHETNPRQAIADLIACVEREALDPLISKPAFDLIEGFKAEALYWKTQRDAVDTPPQRILRHDDRDQLDDIAIGPVDLFRMERMDENRWWMRLSMPDGEDYVFEITTSGRDITVTVEVEKAP